MVPVIPGQFPKIDEDKLNAYPRGYKCLSYCQELTMGVEVLKDMPGHAQQDGGTVMGGKHNELYEMSKKWVEGGDIEI
jgi:hypothetical protein